MVWQVIDLVLDRSGIPHCRIVDVHDPKNIKLISAEILADRNFYQRVLEG